MTTLTFHRLFYFSFCFVLKSDFEDFSENVKHYQFPVAAALRWPTIFRSCSFFTKPKSRFANLLLYVIPDA